VDLVNLTVCPMLPCEPGLSAAALIRRHRDETAKWRTEHKSAATQSVPKPALKHARTEVQSDSESRPIRRTSRCSDVTGNNLKKDG